MTATESCSDRGDAMADRVGLPRPGRSRGFALCVTRAWVAAFALVLLACSTTIEDGGGPATTDAALRAALRRAVPGDVVEVAAGIFVGPFELREGVRVVGRGPQTVLRADNASALLVRTGDSVASVESLTIQVPAGAGAVAGVTATGNGELAFSDVRFDVDVGIGIVADGLGLLRLRRVDFEGALDDERAASVDASTLDAASFPVAGMVVHRATVDLEAVTLRDFARFGAVFSACNGAWRGGSVLGTLGTGALFEASTIELVDVVVADGRAANWVSSLSLAAAVAVTGGSDVVTDSLQLVGNPGLGLLQDRSTSHHLDLRVVGNGDAGLWVQASPGATLDVPALAVAGAVLQGNGRSALVALDVGGVIVDDALVQDTRPRPSLSAALDAGFQADGLQFTAESGAVARASITNSLLFGSARAGVLAAGDAVLVGDAAQRVRLCGPAQIDVERWTCTSEASGVIVCVRQLGPRVEPGWNCQDSVDGVICIATAEGDDASEPALAAELPSGVTASVDGAVTDIGPDDEACRDARSAFLGRAGLVAGLGIARGDALESSVARPHDFVWACEGAGVGRRCMGDAGREIDGGSPDNPTWSSGPGWTCRNTAEGRRCINDQAGFAAAGSVDVEGFASTVDRDATTAARDADLLASAAFDSARFQPETTALAAGLEAVVGENGLVGALGVVGENGVMARAVVGENGLR